MHTPTFYIIYIVIIIIPACFGVSSVTTRLFLTHHDITYIDIMLCDIMLQCDKLSICRPITGSAELH